MEEIITNALECFRNEDFEGALKYFNDALALDYENSRPETPHILSNIGLCHAQLGNDEQAQKIFLKALEFDNTMVQTYINLADSYFRQRKMNDAIGLLQSATSILPDDISLKHYLARIYMEDVRFTDAVELLEEILEVQENNYDANWDLATTYFELGDYENAISNFERVLEFVQTNPVIYYQLASSYEANNEVDKAISNYLKAISLNEKFAPAYKKLGILFLARGDKQDSAEYFEQYSKLSV